MQKRKRVVESPSSDDDDCQFSVSTSCRVVEEDLSDPLSISQRPVSKKPRKDQTDLHDLHSIDKVDVITSSPASGEIQDNSSATREFTLITQVSFIVRDCELED